MQLQINRDKPGSSDPINTKPSNSQKITRIILVRHGRSTYNEQGRYQGSCDDSVLTEKGHKTAYQTGIALREFEIDAIYSSPLKRVQQTTGEILSALRIHRGESRNRRHLQNPPVYIAEQLQEVHMAAWQGLPYQYVKENLIEDYRCWKERPHEFELLVAGKPYYPIPELYKKTSRFWQVILPKHQGKTILIVAHGGTNRALISTAMGLSPKRYHTLQQSNCGMSILEFIDPSLIPLAQGEDRDDFAVCLSGNSEEKKKQTSSVQLTALNLTAHLGEILPKLKEGKQGLRLLLLPSTTAESQAQSLDQALKETSLNFILSADLHRSRAIAEHFLAVHSTTVHLQVLREDFPDAWQQVLLSRRAKDRQQTELVTGLLIAQDGILQNLLEGAIGTNAIALTPGTFSILHYPQVGAYPILQALNFNPNGALVPTCS